MALYSQPADCCEAGMQSNSSSTTSESDSTEEEERLRRLFSTCDRDGDGLIDSQDLLHMCRLLNMEDAVDEIIHHLGVTTHGAGEGALGGQISFEDFMRCRLELNNEVERERLLQGNSVVQPLLHPLLYSGHPDGGGICSGDTVLRTPDNSDISLGLAGAAGSQDYDSGAHDMCGCLGPPVTLFKLLERQEPELLQNYLEAVDCHRTVDVLHAANLMHLAAMSSLKGEIIELSGRLQRVHAEKDVVDKQLAKQQVDRLRVQRELEERLEQQAIRYEDRITELHSVIAELRKKIDLRHINIIREEDEFEESDGIASNQSAEDGSVNDNLNNYSNTAQIGDLNIDISRVTSDLDFAFTDACQLADGDVDLSGHIDADNGNRTDNKTHERAVSGVITGGSDTKFATNTSDPASGTVSETSQRLESQIRGIESENSALQDQIRHQEAELNRLRAQLDEVKEERDMFKRKVHELQKRPQEILLSSSNMSHSSVLATSSPPAERCPTNSQPTSPMAAPVSKVAELKKLRTGRHDRQVLGAEISSLGVSNAKVAEHLARGMQECSKVQEILLHSGSPGQEVPENMVHEFEIELERLQSRVDHLKAQNDVMSLTLSESKAHCDHLTILVGKYESSVTAHQMSTSYADEALNVFQVLVDLLDSELALLSSRCHMSGLPGYWDRHVDESVALGAHRAAEAVAKQLLARLDCHGNVRRTSSNSGAPWDELSSSRTASTVSSTMSGDDVTWSRADELRLRQHLTQLRDDRSVIKLTVVELESIHLDPFNLDSKHDPSEAQKLDLENAVLMQELMAMKEEKAELKAQNHRLMKEKAQLQQLNMRGADVQQERQRSMDSDDGSRSQGGATQGTQSTSVLARDLEEALKREVRLKERVHELMKTLEKLSKNSELRYQQSAGFVNELKKANGALVCAFEKAKKKYVAKMKKMELQTELMTERHESQMALMKSKLFAVEEELRRYQPNFSLSSL
jgi:predicted  nucleic acid-binding Zn-ribbon protein